MDIIGKITLRASMNFVLDPVAIQILARDKRKTYLIHYSKIDKINLLLEGKAKFGTIIKN